MHNFEFIIPAYDSPSELMMCIGSIMSQKSSNWKISVVADGDFDGLTKIINYFEDNDKIKFHVMETRSNDWGHTPRVWGLNNATEEWVIMTGHDNYYFPPFLDAFNGAVDDTTNFMFCDMYHNYSDYVYETSQLRKVVFPNGAWRMEGLDIGAFASRREMAVQIPFNTKVHWADGLFAAEYWEKFCHAPGSIKHIPKGYYVHK